MKKYKWVYLIVALLFPLLLSLFLKYFGKSEFNIPVYYKSGIHSLSIACQYQYSTPYAVPDSIRASLSSNVNKTLIVTTDSSEETKKNIEQIKEEVGNVEYDLSVLKTDSTTARLRSCFLLLNQPWTTVLIDNQNRIRGYYAPSTREETDRLIVELKILLKKY
jgi:protein SCO1